MVAGDLFDLALDPPDKSASDSIGEILSSHPALERALVEHLERGSRVTLLAGNHDPQVAAPEVRRRLLERWAVTREVALAAYPWFIRRGGVHIEHGHFYDPDNAPTHPLCAWDHRTEPLGVAMTRRFVAPNRAMMFAGAYEVTPLEGLLEVLSEYRFRAPMVIANYFTTAGGLCVRARTERRAMQAESARGSRALAEYSAELGVAVSMLEQLLLAGPRPTHHRVRDTFMRLYLDRIFAALGSVGGLLGGLFGSPQWLALTGVGAAYLAASVARQGSRYRDLPGARLRDAASFVLGATDATTVVLGHSHVEDADDGYLNLGSFAFAAERQRPYVEIEPGGRVRRLGFS